MIILLNCIQLATESSSEKEKPDYLVIIDYCFTAAYTLEMVIKILSKGFVLNEGAYLRDAFNILDFVIVMSSLLTIFQTNTSTQVTGTKKKQGVSLNSLRVFRVLRPLRSITAIRGLKILVQSLISALPLLKDTIVVLVFFLLIFAIAGIQLISGSLKMRCVNIMTGKMYKDDKLGLSDQGVLCGNYKCPLKEHYCGKMNANPDFGVTNYDNIFWAFIMTFQNITLEGWSDTQKYYEMTSGLVIIIFFTLNVFLGAFFLLNLTLAVINSSFTRMNEKYQKQFLEEKEKKRKALQSLSKKQDEEQDEVNEDEDDDRMNKPLGLSEFFVAKRASKKMIDYLKHKTEERKKIEALQQEEALRKEELLDEQLRFIGKGDEAHKPMAITNNKQVSPKEKSPRKVIDTPQTEGSNLRKQKYQEFQQRMSLVMESEAKKSPRMSFSGNNKVKHFDQELETRKKQIKIEQADPNMTITEEEHSSVSAQSDIIQQVDKFLQDIDNNKDIQTYREKTNNFPADISASKLIGFIDNGHLLQGAQSVGNRLLNLAENHSRLSDKDSIAFLDDLALDKIIAEEHLQPQNVQTTKKPSDENKNSGESNSLQMSWDYPQYLSDNDIVKPKQGFDEDEVSVISSDPSFNNELMMLEAQAKEQRQIQAKRNNQRDRDIFREARKRYHRQSTIQQKKKKAADQKKSTFYLDSDQSPTQAEKKKFRQSVIIQDGKIQLNQSPEHKETQSPKKKIQKDQRTIISENYKLIDDQFLLWRKPKDPYQFIDRKNKKIDINPGAKYVSSSLNEIRENRGLNMWKKSMNLDQNSQSKRADLQNIRRVNKYLKPEGIFEEQALQENYIQPMFDPYQIKTRYEIKQVEQVEFDSDDEDNLILVIQPYDTVMNVGYQHMLRHLPTKFITRRSDIIVSSTMSITLTPQDDDFVPKNTNTMNEQQIQQWVDDRHEYRASKIYQAKLNDTRVDKTDEKTAFGYKTKSSACLSNSDEYDSDESDQSQQYRRQNGLNRQQRREYNQQRKLPTQGLSNPLTPLEIQRLDKDQQLIYNKWKGKYDAQIRTLSKQKADPTNVHKNYTLEDARKMLNGTFYEHEEVDQPQQDASKIDMNGLDNFVKKMFLNRNNIKDELDLQTFEAAIRKVSEDNQFSDRKANEIFHSINTKDEISDEIRLEFELPDDIKGNKVDFIEVLRSDVNRKRRTPTWSGQDVLCVSYNQDHAEYVTEQMSKLRVWPKGFQGVIKRIRFVMKKFINSAIMDNVMTLAVFINTVIMALDRYGVKEREKQINDQISQFFTYLFIGEFCFKIVAEGPQKYVANRMNLLDGGVVMLSLLEIFMGSGGGGALSAFRTVRVFRTFRVLRVARILRSLKQMQVIISILGKSASSFAYISVLLVIFIFIFALIGMQIFGNKLIFDGEKPRGNYDNFNIAFLTAFQVLTMENWNSLFYDAIRSSQMKAISAMYYISWIFIGNFILLNLFLAILLDSFLQEDEEEQSSEEALAAQKAAEELRKKHLKKEKERRLKKLGQQQSSLTNLLPEQQIIKQEPKKKSNINILAKSMMKKPQDNDLIDDIEDLETKQIVEYLVELKHYQLDKKDIKEVTFADAQIECDRALYLFSQENQFRKFVLKIQKSKFFDNIIMGLIVLSSFKLGLDSYFPQQLKEKKGLYFTISNYTDLVFTVMFAIEMVTKILTMGFIMDDGSYLRESWNQLDFFIVVTSLLDLMMSGQSLGFIKVIRLLRILRPLRFISHNQGMKMIVAALLDSGGAMLNVLIVIMIVWLMFAILGIQLFMGKFFYCSEDPYLLHSKTDCINAGYKWLKFDTNFDNVQNAMKTLFIVATFEGWPAILHQAVDATGIDQGPMFENNILYGYYFVIFILVGSFFLVNFLIGVLFLKYTQAQKEEAKNFTQEQLNWIDIQQMIGQAQVDHAYRYQPRGSYLRMKVWKIVNSDWFGLVVMAAILLNMVQMACSYDGMPAYVKRILNVSNYVFSGIFLVECLLKLFVYRKSYFYTTWNKFDFFVVCASIIDVLLDFVSGSKIKALSVVPQLSRVLRVLRVSRVLRLAGKNEGLQALLMTIEMSVTALLNVTALLMLILFMFAVLGGFMFQNVTASDDVYTLQELDPEFKNFKNFHSSLILIFTLATGENWPLVMYDVSKTKKNCGATTCGSSYSVLFFIMFVMIVQKIMLNLFILVIIQQFEQYYVSEDNPIQKFKRNLVLFEKVWIEFTEKQNNVKIKEKMLTKFFKQLPLPIGIPEEISEPEMKKQMLKMGIRGEDGYIYFNELLYRCMRRVYGRFKLNRAMTIFEIQTQFGLLQLREAQKEQGEVSKQDQLVKKLSERQFAFNPFMLNMFQKISFNKWINMARNEILKREYEQKIEAARKIAEENGSDFHPSEKLSQIVLESEQRTTYLEEKEEIVYITSEEELDSEDQQSYSKSKSFKQQGNSHLDSSFEKQQVKSPELKRKQFINLKKALTKRFRSTGQRSGSMYSQSPDNHQDSPDPNLGSIIKSGKQMKMMILGLDERIQKKKTKINEYSPKLGQVAEQDISFDD